ncbi:transposase [Loktanella sp. PT4BL]|uniref:Transposase n=1 Tax=Yoonia vestfoldensis TaxID=245188 RepID=A0A1Y0EFY1_9RHOB|nr:transposase [Yoonia vestfoldensis]PXW66315.1 transposase [Loktanella sp. PT4BL]
MKTSRYTETQIIVILRQAESGVPVSELCRGHGMSEASFYIYGCLSLCKIFADLFRRQVPGCKHLSGVTLRWCAQMGIPRGEPQQMVGLSRPL